MASFFASLVSRLSEHALGPSPRFYPEREFLDATPGARFGCGVVMVTPGAAAAARLAGTSARALMARHLSGDWGELTDGWERQHNEDSLAADEGDFQSRYLLATGDTVSIGTMYDRQTSWIALEGE